MILDKSNGRYEQPYYKYSKKIAPHEGTVYVVTGSSSKVDDGPMDHPVNVVNIKSLGSMVIDIDGNRLDAKFINDKMQVLDNFSIVKGHVAAKRTYTSCP
jgi:hypothetical protein